MDWQTEVFYEQLIIENYYCKNQEITSEGFGETEFIS